jgi:NitT/TauT family transport system substrate-binding protein
VLAVLVALVAAACGGSGPTPRPTRAQTAPPTLEPTATPAGPPSPSPSTATSVRVQLRGTIRTEFAGFIAAIDEGYYEEADLAVTLVEAPPGTDAVEAGSEPAGPEFTIAWVPGALEARGKGASDLVDIAQLFQRSGTLSLSWRDDGITAARDFKDRKVGAFAFGDGSEILAGAVKAGLKPGKDFEAVTQEADLDGPLGRNVDVAQATIYDGYARLLESTDPHTRALYESSALNVINWYDEGTAMLQDAVFARSSWLDREGNEDVARRFLKATFLGWIHCRDHPAECVQSTIAAAERPVVSTGSVGGGAAGASASPASQATPAGQASPAAQSSAGSSPGTSNAPRSPEPRPTFGPGHHAWAMNEVNALVWPSPAGLGVIDQTLWDHTVDVCLTAGFIPSAPPPDAARSDLAEAALTELSDLDTTGLAFAKSTIEITPDGR